MIFARQVGKVNWHRLSSTGEGGKGPYKTKCGLSFTRTEFVLAEWQVSDQQQTRRCKDCFK